MRFRILSDLHVAHHYYHILDGIRPALSGDSHDAVIVAGDVECRNLNTFKRLLLDLEKPVFVILGNHDHYLPRTAPSQSNYEQRVGAYRHALQGEPSIHFLDNESVNFNGVDIFGTTLWAGMGWAENGHSLEYVRSLVQEGISDFRVIPNWSVSEMVKRHRDSLTALNNFLNTAGSTKVVISHFLPSRQLIAPQYAGSPYNPYYATELDSLVEKANLWVSGHTHTAYDTKIGNCRMVCNPLGYPGENPEYNFDKVVEVLTPPPASVP